MTPDKQQILELLKFELKFLGTAAMDVPRTLPGARN